MIESSCSLHIPRVFLLSRLSSSREGIHVLSIEDVGELGELLDVELTKDLIDLSILVECLSCNLSKVHLLLHFVVNVVGTDLSVAVRAAAGAAATGAATRAAAAGAAARAAARTAAGAAA